MALTFFYRQGNPDHLPTLCLSSVLLNVLTMDTLSFPQAMLYVHLYFGKLRVREADAQWLGLWTLLPELRCEPGQLVALPQTQLPSCKLGLWTTSSLMGCGDKVRAKAGEGLHDARRPLGISFTGPFYLSHNFSFTSLRISVLIIKIYFS